MKQAIAKLATARGKNVIVECVDVRIGNKIDLSYATIRQKYLDAMKSKVYQAILLSPPCSTFSRACWRNFKGPRPVRNFRHWRGLQVLTAIERRKCNLGNTFADFAWEVVSLAVDIDSIVFLAFENPEDLGSINYGPQRRQTRQHVAVGTVPRLDIDRQDSDLCNSSVRLRCGISETDTLHLEGNDRPALTLQEGAAYFRHGRQLPRSLGEGRWKNATFGRSFSHDRDGAVATGTMFVDSHTPHGCSGYAPCYDSQWGGWSFVIDNIGLTLSDKSARRPCSPWWMGGAEVVSDSVRYERIPRWRWALLARKMAAREEMMIIGASFDSST